MTTVQEQYKPCWVLNARRSAPAPVEIHADIVALRQKPVDEAKVFAVAEAWIRRFMNSTPPEGQRWSWAQLFADLRIGSTVIVEWIKVEWPDYDQQNAKGAIDDDPNWSAGRVLLEAFHKWDGQSLLLEYAKPKANAEIRKARARFEQRCELGECGDSYCTCCGRSCDCGDA